MLPFILIHWQPPALRSLIIVDPLESKLKQCVLSTTQEQGPEEDQSIDPVSYSLQRRNSRIVHQENWKILICTFLPFL
jgi:hypothetical protein